MATRNTTSVIIPTFNRAHLIARSVNSAMTQLNDDDEIIVVDDGSTDNTKEVVSQFGGRLKYYKTLNEGAGKARNFGVKKSRGEFIAFLDSDDEWMPWKLQAQKDFLNKRKDILFCFSNCAFRTKTGDEKHFTLGTWHNDKRPWNEILGNHAKISQIISLPNGISDFDCYIGNIYKSALLYGNYLNVNTLLVRRKEAGEELRFAENTNVYEEWECLGRLARIGKCAYLDCETVWQNAHPGPRLTDADSPERLYAQLSIMKNVWGRDRGFLERHGKLYLKVLKQKQASKIGSLVLRGRIEEYRKEIYEFPGCPLYHRALSRFPSKFAVLFATGLYQIKKRIMARKNKRIAGNR